MFDAKDEAWDKEMLGACKSMEVALAVRRKWTPDQIPAKGVKPAANVSYDAFGGPLPPPMTHTYKWENGVVNVYTKEDPKTSMFSSPDLSEFLTDFLAVMSIAATPEESEPYLNLFLHFTFRNLFLTSPLISRSRLFHIRG